MVPKLMIIVTDMMTTVHGCFASGGVKNGVPLFLGQTPAAVLVRSVEHSPDLNIYHQFCQIETFLINLVTSQHVSSVLPDTNIYHKFGHISTFIISFARKEDKKY